MLFRSDEISENALPTHSFLKRFTYHDRYRADGGLGSLADHQLKFQATPPNRPTKLNFSNNNFFPINFIFYNTSHEFLNVDEIFRLLDIFQLFLLSFCFQTIFLVI